MSKEQPSHPSSESVQSQLLDGFRVSFTVEVQRQTQSFFSVLIDGHPFTVETSPEQRDPGSDGFGEGFNWNGRWSIEINNPRGAVVKVRPTNGGVARAIPQLISAVRERIRLENQFSQGPNLRVFKGDRK